MASLIDLIHPYTIDDVIYNTDKTPNDCSIFFEEANTKGFGDFFSQIKTNFNKACAIAQKKGLKCYLKVDPKAREDNHPELGGFIGVYFSKFNNVLYTPDGAPNVAAEGKLFGVDIKKAR